MDQVHLDIYTAFSLFGQYFRSKRMNRIVIGKRESRIKVRPAPTERPCCRMTSLIRPVAEAGMLESIRRDGMNDCRHGTAAARRNRAIRSICGRKASLRTPIANTYGVVQLRIMW